MKWLKYPDLERISRLKNEGRELLGKEIYFTEKRDGENVSIWIDEKQEIKISSHNMVDAETSIVDRFKTTKEYPKICEFLLDELRYSNNYIAYGELVPPTGPTRIERRKKETHWILFDICGFDGKFLHYNLIYQKAHVYKIPIVKTLCLSTPNSIQNLIETKDWVLKHCVKHRREGVVGKCYITQTFFKEKIDLPKLEKLENQTQNVQLPSMDEHTILRSLQHAFDIVGEENWMDKTKAMPIVAQQFQVEAREHNFASPRNMFDLYLNTSISILRSREVVENG